MSSEHRIPRLARVDVTERIEQKLRLGLYLRQSRIGAGRQTRVGAGVIVRYPLNLE